MQLDNTKKVLYKEIQQAWYNAVAAESKYNSSEVAVKANEESIRLMSEKYNNGKATFVEYNEAKLYLTKALSDKLQAKYDYLFRTKILDFYKGEIIEYDRFPAVYLKPYKQNTFLFLRLYSCFQTPPKALVIYVRDF